MNYCTLLWNEYQLAFTAYEAFNYHFLILKGWSVTFALAALVAVYTEKLGKAGRPVLWIAVLSAIPFWVLDASWKAFQKGYERHLRSLEIDCTGLKSYTFEIMRNWDDPFEPILKKNWSDAFDVWGSAFALSSVSHVFVLIVGIFLALTFKPKTQEKAE